jgi:WD40 repeat protein
MTADPLPHPPADTGSVDAENPWPGLASFQEADQEFFHGREEETEEILRLVLRERLTVLFGLSGLGKTSLLQAGLFPRLRQENVFPVAIRLDFSEGEGGRRPLTDQIKDAIAREAAAAEVEIPAARDSETLWEYFHRQGADFWNARNRPVTPLLAFDQFEEIFTLGRRSPGRAREAEALLSELAALCEGAPPESVRARLDEHPEEAREFSFSRHAYKVLFSLREDFVPDLEGLKGRIRAISQNRFRLRRMNGLNALQVVTRAGRRLVEREVADNIVRFVAGRGEADETPLADLEVEPALLSVVCRELNNKRRLQGAPRITSGLLQGNREEILTGFYERSLADLPEPVRTFIEERLLTVSGFRDSVALENALENPGVTREAIDRLTDRRILRLEDRGGVQRVELTHDVLTGVVRASRDSRRQKEAQARAEAARREAEERERAAREALQRQRRLAFLLGGLLVAALVGAGWGFWGMLQARKALADAAVERAYNLQNQRPAHALAHLAYALRLDPESLQARSLALDLLARRSWPLPLVEVRHDDNVNTAEYSPDGRLFVTASDDGTARIWNAATGEPAGEPLRHEGPVTAARFSQQDGRYVLTESGGKVRLWEVNGNSVDLGSDEVRAARIGPGSRLTTVLRNEVLVRDAGPGTPARRVYSPPRGLEIGPIIFSPDGSLVALGLIGWDVRSGVIIHLEEGAVQTLPEPFSLPWEPVSFSPEGRFLLADFGSGIDVLDVHRNSLAGQPLEDSPIIIYESSFSPDGNLAAFAARDDQAVVWQLSPERKIFALQHGSDVYTVHFSRDGRSLLTASEDATARIWDARSGNPLGEPFQHEDGVYCARFSPRGEHVLTASADGTARIWDLRTGGLQTRILKLYSEPDAAVISPDGTRIFVSDLYGLDLINLAQGETSRISKDESPVDIAPDGRTFVTVRGLEAQLWETATRRPLAGPLRHHRSILSAAFSSDGQQLVTVSEDGLARIWDVRTGGSIAALREESPIKSASLSPLGDRLLTVSAGRKIHIRETASGRTIGQPMFLRNIQNARFTPSGDRIVAATYRAVYSIDPRTNKFMGKPMIHSDLIDRFEISPDSRSIVTITQKGVLRMWSLASGEPLGNPVDAKEPVLAARFIDGGNRIVAVTKRGVHVWNLPHSSPDDAGALAELAEAVGGFRFDPDHGMLRLQDQIGLLARLRAEAVGAAPSEAGVSSFTRRFFDRRTRPDR